MFYIFKNYHQEQPPPPTLREISDFRVGSSGRLLLYHHLNYVNPQFKKHDKVHYQCLQDINDFDVYISYVRSIQKYNIFINDLFVPYSEDI